MKNHFGNYINGKWITGSGQTFHSCNPATGEKIFEVFAASNFEIESSITAAKNAFSSWRNFSINDRITYLNRFGQELKIQQVELAKAISLETGKPGWESHEEVSSMISKIDISIESYSQRCPQKESSLISGKSITRHKPHGIIAVLGPFNFPGHLPNGHIIPTLLAGNTLIFKPSEYTPLVGTLIAQCWERTQLPPGVFNLIQGGKETGQKLSSHPGLNGLFFTGSWATGKHLLETFALHPEKILALEMGGNNPLVVSKISNVQAAAYITLQSAYLTAGQRCSCARRLIVIENSSSEAYLDALIKMIRLIQIGSFTEVPEPFMGPVISPKAAQSLLDKQSQLKQMGGFSLLTSKQLKVNTGFISPGLMDVSAIDRVPDEEIFGPFLQLIRVKDLGTAILAANNTQYGLSAGLLSDDPEEFSKFYRDIQAGIINWNTPLTGASSSSPFGGIGTSGNHRPSAFYAADYCSYPIASMEAEELKIPVHTLPGINFND